MTMSNRCIDLPVYLYNEAMSDESGVGADVSMFSDRKSPYVYNLVKFHP